MSTAIKQPVTNTLDKGMVEQHLHTVNKFRKYLDKKGVYYKSDQPFTISSGALCYGMFYFPAIRTSIEVEGVSPSLSRDPDTDALLLAEHGVLTIRLQKEDIYEGEAKQQPIWKILFDRAGCMAIEGLMSLDAMKKHLLTETKDWVDYALSLRNRLGLSPACAYRPWYSKSLDTFHLTHFHLFCNRLIPIYALNKLMFSGELTCIEYPDHLDRLDVSEERKTKTQDILSNQKEIILSTWEDLNIAFAEEHNLFLDGFNG